MTEAQSSLSAVRRESTTDAHGDGQDQRVELFEEPDEDRGSTWSTVRRLRWLVLAIWVICLSAALITTITTPTTYTARSSMIVSSNNRSPDQDAVLVQGYVDYFNNSAYQSALLAQAQVDAPVTVTARAAASSPIMLIEATSTSGAVAQDAAALIALHFQQDINEVREEEKADEIDSWQRRLDQLVETGGPGSDGAASALQERIVQIRADRVNELQELQLGGGISTNAPSVMTNALFGSIGGLLLGILVALGCARLMKGGRGSPRRPRASDG